MSDIENKLNPRSLSDTDFDRLVYLRLFEGCNLYCDHCFIPSNPKKMSDELIASVPDLIRSFSPSDAKVLIQWHGGEPTALGRDHLQSALEALDKEKGDLTFTHGIQTNLMNYTSEWADLYHRYFDGQVGISWDYKIRKKHGSDNADSFEAAFWPNLEQLLKDGLQPYFVVTGTKLFFERFKNPFELFEFFESRGVYHLHIERLTEVGNARHNWSEIGVNNKEYSDYMSRLYKGYKIYSELHKNRDSIRLSPFDGLDESVTRLLSGQSGGYGCLSGSCDTKYHTIDANGYKPGCTALNSETDNKVIHGDVQPLMIFDPAATRVERQVSCEGCQYQPICSSGCLALTKIDESNECSGAWTLFNTIERHHKLT